MKNDPFSQMHYHTLPAIPLIPPSLSHFVITLSSPFCSYSPSISRSTPIWHSTSTLLPPSINFSLSPSLTFDWTSALWSFWSSSAADFVSSLRAAMCRAGRRTLPLVSCSNSRETTELWPCWRAMASGVKPSWRSREEETRQMTE